MPSNSGSPRHLGEDEEEFQPLPAEDEAGRVNERFATASAQDRKGHSLTHDLAHAEQRRVEAQAWKTKNGFAEPILQSFRTDADLEGALAWIGRKMLGKARDDARADVLAEIQRRRVGGERVPLSKKREFANPFGNQQRWSRGRPRKTPKITLRRSQLSTDDNQ